MPWWHYVKIPSRSDVKWPRNELWKFYHQYWNTLYFVAHHQCWVCSLCCGTWCRQRRSWRSIWRQWEPLSHTTSSWVWCEEPSWDQCMRPASETLRSRGWWVWRGGGRSTWWSPPPARGRSASSWWTQTESWSWSSGSSSSTPPQQTSGSPRPRWCWPSPSSHSPAHLCNQITWLHFHQKQKKNFYPSWNSLWSVLRDLLASRGLSSTLSPTSWTPSSASSTLSILSSSGLAGTRNRLSLRLK